MIRITCDPATVRLIVPMCAEQPITAALSRRSHCTHELAITTSGQNVTLSDIPDDIERGVWRLSIATPCGCYEMDVFMDMCPPIRVESVHTPTDDTGTIIECCEEPEVPGV